MEYLIVKWLHILAAIVAVGANATYGIWLAHAKKNKLSLPFTLRVIKKLDDRFANPAYGVLLITGFAMTGMAHLPISTPWIMISLILFVLLIVIGIFGYTPTLKKQIAVVEAEGVDSVTYLKLAQRGKLLGMILGILAIAIIYLMTVKPGVTS